ncbi:MAG: DUF2818 family protein [Burkholderiaceae bacterium]|jgi:hypothetical protein|nr:DUF2818 family protein [Burkholderiaceae bacterium]
MNTSLAVFSVIVLAALAANLPFVTRRFLGVRAMPQGKTVLHHLIELVVLYAVVGLVGMLLERQIGQNAPQRWEFYAVTGALFLTLAFPGFVYRYLMRHPRR